MWTVYEMACFLPCPTWRWASSCDHAATSSAVLYRISLTSGWCLSFSSSTEFFLVVNRDRYPQLRFLQPGFRVLQCIDKVVDVPGDAVALGAVRLESGHHFLKAPCSGSHLPLCVATVHGCFCTISSFFYVKSGLGSPCSSHLEIWNYFYEQYLAVTACVSLRCFWKNFTYFHRVGCPGFPAHLEIWTLFLLAVLTHFSRSSGFQFLEPSMAKSSLPSRAPHAN